MPPLEPTAAIQQGRSTLLYGISELITNDPAAGPGLLGIVPDAAVVMQDGQIVWVGPAASAPVADTAVDLGGRAVLPGWVDSHSHVVFAGDRAAEFAARMAGQPYRAGGMQSTVVRHPGGDRCGVVGHRPQTPRGDDRRRDDLHGNQDRVRPDRA